MGEKYRENFCLDVVLSRQIQWFLCVDFNKNKYEGALTQSAAKDPGTSQYGVQLIFWEMVFVVFRTPKNFWVLKLLNCQKRVTASGENAFFT